MTCATCGREEQANANFCSNCGRVLSFRVNPASSLPYEGRLVRPHQGRMVAGVCAGLAMHYGWDVSLVRIVLVLAVLCGAGLPLVAYLAEWIVIPNALYLLPAGTPAAVQPAGTMGR